MKISPTHLALSALFAAACAAPAVHDSVAGVATQTAKKMWAEQAEGTLTMHFGDETVAVVRYDAAPSPCIWPLHAPGGVPVTRAWPLAEVEGEERDHPHHRSAWIAHGDVDGVDFWAQGGERPGTIEYTARLLEQFPRQKRFLTGFEYAWKSPEGETLLVERRRIEFGCEEGYRWMDFELRFHTPREEVTFGDTKEGFFALRMHPALRLKGDLATGEAVNSEGVTGKDVWGKRAAWVHYQGTVDGQEVGIAIFDHPDNLRHPTWWHARDYGLVAANPFGAHDFEGAPAGTGDFVLKKGETLLLRYRIWIHAGRKTPAEIAEQSEVYRAQVK